MRALREEKYHTLAPIQAQTIPTVTSGRDLIGIAQTGTGKTAAFALPILHLLAASPRPPVLVVGLKGHRLAIKYPNMQPV